MNCYLSHRSALFYWRHIWPRAKTPKRPIDHTMRSCASTLSQLRDSLPFEIAIALLPERTSTGFGRGTEALRESAPSMPPLEVLVERAEDKRSSSSHVCHAWSTPIPTRAFQTIEPHAYVSSPEFLFVQMASQLDLVELIALGMELCGTYVFDGFGLGESASTAMRREPLTTAAKLRSFVQACPGARGHRKALRASRYVLDGAASPGETEAALLFTLPRLLGGHALPAPRLNHRIDLDDIQRALARRTYCVADMCWPKQQLIVEYYGQDYHSGPESMRSDIGRQDALSHAGYHMEIVTATQLRSIQQFDGIAHSLGRRLGVRMPNADARWTERAMETRAALIRWHQPTAPKDLIR